MFSFRPRTLLAVLLLTVSGLSFAQTSQVAWLRYAIPPDPPRYHDLPHTVVLLGNGAGQAAPEEEAAAEELDRGLGHMVAGTDLLLRRFDPRVDAIVLGTTASLHRARLGRSLPGWVEKPLAEEGFRITHLRRGIRHWYILQGGSPRAELWAAFRFAALVAEDQQLPEELTESPQLALRAVQLEGDPAVLPTTSTPGARLEIFRLLASVGINALIGEADAAQAPGLAAAIRPYGMRLWLTRALGESVQAAALRASAAPNIAGVVMSASSDETEDQRRDAVRDANALAKLLQHTGRAVLLQGVLGPPLRSNGDTEAAATARPLDLAGAAFEPNVIVASRAASPLLPLAGLGSARFGQLSGTQQAAEFDLLPVRTEDVAYPLPAWQRVLRTPERGLHGTATLLDVLRAPSDVQHGGIIGRMPLLRLAEWMQQPLLQANVYAFGRMAWNQDLSAEAITEEWSRQTWGDDARVHSVATRILLDSTSAYVKNSSPLGLASLSDASGGPDPSHVNVAHGSGGRPLADSMAFGTDRGPSGTGELAAYPDGFAAMLGNAATCPEEWLLAVHRVPYTALLPGGKTAAQTFYDAHFAGAAQGANALDAWEGTRQLVDERRYRSVHDALDEASRQAEIWRESTTEWLQRLSGVHDALGFVGSHPGRINAAGMQRSGYALVPDDLPDSGETLLCREAACSASLLFTGEANVYRVEIGFYRDPSPAEFELRVNGASRARWKTSAFPDAPNDAFRPSAAERAAANGIALQKGDRVEVYATPHGGRAPLQFVEITRDPRWN